MGLRIRVSILIKESGMTIKIVKRSVGSEESMKVNTQSKKLKKAEGKSTSKETISIGETTQLPVGSINPETGKRVMPKSPGRPKGTKGNGRTRKRPLSTVLGGPKGDQMEGLLKKTATMTDSELLEEARKLREQDDAAKAKENEDRIPEAPLNTSARRDAMSSLVYRMSVRGLTVDQISEQIGLNPSQTTYLLQRLHKQLKLDPKTLDVGYYMGESLAFYAEVRQMSLLAASHSGNTPATKLRAMEVALQAETAKNNFLTKIGVYSPTIVERIERWVVGTTDQMTAPPTSAKRINLASAVGKALSRRVGPDSNITDVAP